MKIKTNGVPRHIIGWSDLTEREKCEHDYMLSKAHQESAQFVRYKGNVYSIADFVFVSENIGFPGWQGYKSDSYFSGVLIRTDKLFHDGIVIMGEYYV
jgi:hypothetical protein